MVANLEESSNSKGETVTTRVRARKDIIAFHSVILVACTVGFFAAASFSCPLSSSHSSPGRHRWAWEEPPPVARRRSRRVSSAREKGKAENKKKKKLLCRRPFHLNPNEAWLEDSEISKVVDLVPRVGAPVRLQGLLERRSARKPNLQTLEVEEEGRNLFCCFFFHGAHYFCYNRIPMYGGSHSTGDASHIQAPIELYRAYLSALHSSHHLHDTVMSFLSLILNDRSIYFNSIREVYEAWVIYNFLSLCLAWVGGPGAVVLNLSGRSLKPSWYLMTCCLPSIPLDGRFIRRCKQGGLQFVILKPILVVITFILYAKGKYEDGNFSVDQAYLYITIIYTVSYSMALYALALFYVACKDLLRPFNPVPKFIIIKSVVFLTYWQGVLVFLAAKSGFIKNSEAAAEFQNFVLCVEMLAAAVGHLYAFPYKEYAGANIGGSGGLRGSLVHALKFNDFYHDTVHQFAPTYHDYVLYNNNDGDEGARKYRSRTFVPMGQEMDAVRKNKHTYQGKLDDTRLSSVSTSNSGSPVITNKLQDQVDLEAIKSSLLKDSAAASARPYDFSVLLATDLSNYPAKVPAVDDSSKRLS
ncbi:hypothetical protein C4D60_Mb01t07000 [Musa balbisiana]|uniref:Transmembrane protein 184A n=1 Tax=Musa balbisiana TaxID=52838 RepID=A0A4S8JKF6_MUSBA|nr:hypothetical protein C4D60_Mb01t07000 [Musa balbisiana]